MPKIQNHLKPDTIDGRKRMPSIVRNMVRGTERHTKNIVYEIESLDQQKGDQNLRE